MKATLLRIADTEFGVFGLLDLFDTAGVRIGRFHTAEDDWANNQPRESCIPPGHYTCRRGIFPRMGETFEVTGVPGRSAILIHAGNTENDVEGCILLGEAFGALTVPDEDTPAHPVRLAWSVVSSKPAVYRFMALCVDTQSFALDVRWATPGEWR